MIGKISVDALQIIKLYSDSLWEKKDLSVVDQYCVPDVLVHSPMASIQGIQKMKEIMLQWHVGFPHLKVHWDEFVCEGETVVSRWHAEGNHEGDFLGIAPTQRLVKYPGATIYHLNQGKIKEYWAYVNIQHIKEQLTV